MQFPKGTRVIEACTQAGKFIPHYCYHPKLSSPGNCRMCLVEMGMPKMTPDRKPVLGADGKPEIALDSAAADFLRAGRERGHGHPHGLADGAGVPQGRDGVPAHQSSARLPDLRPGGRVPAAGILRRVRQRRIRASSSTRSRSRRTSNSGRASRSTPSAASFARAASAS